MPENIAKKALEKIDEIELTEDNFEEPQMEKDLKELRSNVEKFKKIDRDVLISYLRDKTKLSKRDIKELLFQQDRFFDKVGV